MEAYNFGAKSSVRIKWTVKSSEYSKDKAAEMERAFAKKYGIDARRVHVEPDIVSTFATVDAGNESIKNIRDPRFQQKLIKAYLEENNIQDADESTILQIDDMVNSQIDYKTYSEQKAFSIDYIKFDNFMAYGSGQFVSFDGLEGLVLIESNPANQGGKTTFAIDLIHMGLFGKPIPGRAKTNAGIFNRNLPNENKVYIEIGLIINGEKYIIKRTFTRPELGKKNRDTVTQKVTYYHIINGEETELTSDSENCGALGTVDTNRVITNAIGEEKDFDTIVSATASNLADMISSKQADRDRMMLKYLGMDILHDKEEIANDIWKTRVKSSLICDAYNKTELLNNIDTLNYDNEEAGKIKDKKNAVLAEIEKHLIGYGKKRDELLTSKRTIDASIASYDLPTINTKLEQIKLEGVQKKNQHAAIEAKIKELPEVVFDGNELRDKQERRIEILTEISKIKAEIAGLKANNKTLSESEYCPTCKRKFENVDNTEAINQNNAEIEKKIQLGIALKNELTGLEVSIASLEEAKTTSDERNSLEIKKEALWSNILCFRQEYTKYLTIANGLKANAEAIEFNNKVTAEINMVDAAIRQENNNASSVRTEISGIERDITANNTVIEQHRKLIAKIDEDAKTKKNWDYYRTIIGREGISKMVLRNALPLLNERIASYLGADVNFAVEVGMNEKNEVILYIIKDGVRDFLSTGSGYEQTIGSLALRSALGIISTLPTPPFLLFDEVLSGVNRVNYEHVKAIMTRIAKDYKYIFQITHLDDVKEWHKTILYIEQDANGIASISRKK